ncbi:4Fe-4S dicluster domain-containing protein [Desulforamulus aquiferis]|uniref:4Fe-4S dicluster domain-containing protein n=1 Tax=Desulforamulus aquiferis TaxID=1397668 RepID=A0AAW7ZA45_9FIRM|nr:4Fe-4S dicluster domain-containing protein [Desulforamulus aquiferis]MDO7786148.1 4Fe-4S dicluster domain-containing protein [Desulforamulus aquiferis]
MAKGSVEVDSIRCKGCSICIEICPKKVLGLSKESNPKGYYFVRPEQAEECTGCAMCAQMCPDVAIKVWRQAAAQ